MTVSIRFHRFFASAVSPHSKSKSKLLKSLIRYLNGIKTDIYGSADDVESAWRCEQHVAKHSLPNSRKWSEPAMCVDGSPATIPTNECDCFCFELQGSREGLYEFHFLHCIRILLARW